MDLNLFKNLKNDIKSNATIQNFMEDISNFLKDISPSFTSDKKVRIAKDSIPKTRELLLNINTPKPKEGHLYFVTEDRNNEIYLWDFTDKPKYEFKETNFSQELLSVAKEGSMLQYKNGEYSLYSSDGYNMLFDEKVPTHKK